MLEGRAAGGGVGLGVAAVAVVEVVEAADDDGLGDGIAVPAAAGLSFASD